MTGRRWRRTSTSAGALPAEAAEGAGRQRGGLVGRRDLDVNRLVDVLIATVTTSVTAVPCSVMTAFRITRCPSTQTVNVAVLIPAAAICFCIAALALPERYCIPLSRETVPVYSVTGTPSMVPVPTLRTPLAPASIWDSLSGLLFVAWLKSWLRLTPLLLLRADTGIASHGLVVCSCWVSNDHFR